MIIQVNNLLYMSDNMGDNKRKLEDSKINIESPTKKTRLQREPIYNSDLSEGALQKSEVREYYSGKHRKKGKSLSPQKFKKPRRKVKIKYDISREDDRHLNNLLKSSNSNILKNYEKFNQDFSVVWN